MLRFCFVGKMMSQHLKFSAKEKLAHIFICISSLIHMDPSLEDDITFVNLASTCIVVTNVTQAIVSNSTR